MADERLVKYFKDHMAQYSLDALKKHSLEKGFDAATVEEAAAIASGAASMPAPTLAPAEQKIEYIDFKLANVWTNAGHLITRPEEFFSRINPQGSLKGPYLFALAWSALAIPFRALSIYIRKGEFPKVQDPALLIGFIVLFPLIILVMLHLGTLFYHIILKALGGKSRYNTTFAIMSCFYMFGPIGALLDPYPVAGGAISVAVCLYFMVQAASGAHKIPKLKAAIGIPVSIFCFFLFFLGVFIILGYMTS